MKGFIKCDICGKFYKETDSERYDGLTVFYYGANGGRGILSRNSNIYDRNGADSGIPTSIDMCTRCFDRFVDWAKMCKSDAKNNLKWEEKEMKEYGTRNVAKHLAEIRNYIKMIKSESVLIAEVDVTTSSAEVNFSKDDSVEHDIVTNMFDNVSAVFKDLNAIKSETGVELEVYMTAVGIHFESSKNNLVFSISVTKSDLDNVTYVATSIQKTIDIAIKKVID